MIITIMMTSTGIIIITTASPALPAGTTMSTRQ